MTNYDKVCKIISVPKWNDIENLVSKGCIIFFQALTPRLMLSCYLFKKQKYFPNSKSVLYTKIKVNRNKYKGYLSRKSLVLYIELLCQTKARRKLFALTFKVQKYSSGRVCSKCAKSWNNLKVEGLPQPLYKLLPYKVRSNNRTCSSIAFLC